MLQRFSLRTAGLMCGLAGWLVLLAPAVHAQGSAPEWKYGVDFQVRKAGEPDFDKNTPRFSCEFFLDKTNNQGLYISETGSITVVTAPPLLAESTSETKHPKWLYGLALKVRKPDEKDFTPSTRKYGIECFRDPNSGLIVYLSETGSVAAIKGSASAAPPPEAKAPTWLFGLVLPVRKGPENDFTDKTAKYGLERFRDENNGNLVYITETGAIAVIAPAAAPIPREPRSPRWLRGLSFKVRLASQPDFVDDTPNFGSELYKDENTGNLLYIAEKGAIAVVTGGELSGGKALAPKWLRGYALKVRKAGEGNFNKDTKQFGGEVFRDENTGNLVYLTETAALAVTTGK